MYPTQNCVIKILSYGLIFFGKKVSKWMFFFFMSAVEQSFFSGLASWG